MPRFGLLEDDESDTVKCPVCHGKGKLFDSKDPNDWKLLEKTGKETPCSTCGGSGYVQDNSSRGYN